MEVVSRRQYIFVFIFGLSLTLYGTVSPQKATNQASAKGKPAQTQEPQTQPQSGTQGGESSSRDTLIDLSPPAGDASEHPDSGDMSGISEMHRYDPHRAQKDIEVGDFYFKRQNYKAALARYSEALEYKPNDALATFHLAETQEKLGNAEEARKNYQSYLKILPKGPYAANARKALERLKPKTSSSL